MADYSAMKSYLEKNNHYFTSSPNSETPIKAVIHHLPSDASDISNSPKDLGINVKGMKAT
jgi:hypothetical protein